MHKFIDGSGNSSASSEFTDGTKDKATFYLVGVLNLRVIPIHEGLD